nr:bifunctional diaminohydroxyphosphoribosylaminopyrimidine deaminase/5-amino-6-(5-phosphoribosylamino)uracil reductase RibD [uncultured Cohaesibacter sp.]
MDDYAHSLTDEQLMDLALRLGRRCAGTTAENPAVGCVIARQQQGRMEIVGRGWTQRGGRPHAERVALAEAGEKAREATAYVTLEPCSHTGKSGPCADALIEVGIARVVCAHPDPDARVAGRGFEKLRNAGIAVELGLFQSSAHRDLAGFLSRTVRNRPWLQVKMAFSRDGMIGRKGEGNYPVTGPQAKSRTYALRSRADAILIGCDTALIDDPTLTVRLPGLDHTSPIRIVIDGKGRLPLTSKLVQSANKVPLWVVTGQAMREAKSKALESMGCRIVPVASADEGHLDLLAAMEKLAQAGINKLFAECGASLADQLLRLGLVDEFFLYRSPQIIGEGGLPALDGQPEERLRSMGLRFEKSYRIGEDRLRQFVSPASLQDLYGG